MKIGVTVGTTTMETTLDVLVEMTSGFEDLEAARDTVKGELHELFIAALEAEWRKAKAQVDRAYDLIQWAR